jgi:peptidyl-prolyl cis-trans isomerase A (cyclophilin A)
MTPALANEKAPASYNARFDTSRGVFVIEVHREWAPNGADRFYNLVKIGFYDDVRFFRVYKGLLAQFGMNGSPDVTKAWRGVPFPDDPAKQSNKRGWITFASSGRPNSRGTQVFINLKDTTDFDQQFVPFGYVKSGLDIVDHLYSEYIGDIEPEQRRLALEGNAYLKNVYPELDFVKKATIQK